MKTTQGETICTINNIEWHLREEEIAGVLRDFSHPPEERRHYGVYPFKAGKVFVKSFSEKGLLGYLRNKISPRGKREYLLGRKLVSLSIRTPEMYGYGIGPVSSSVVEEWIPGKSFIKTFLESTNKTALVIALAELLKRLKEKHVLHNDLHLDNILASEGALYLIDLHKMTIRQSFTRGDEMCNLSHALAMAYWVMSEEEKIVFFLHYGRDGIRDEVEKTLRTMHYRWILRKKQRAFKETSRMSRKCGYLSVKGKESFGQGAFVETVKKDRKITVERYDDHIRKIYAQKRRLKRAWKAHMALVYLDISVIPDTFCLKMARPFSPGYICMEDLSRRGEELDRHIDRKYDAMNSAERKNFAERLALFLGNAIRSGVMHRDLKGCNIFVLNDGTFRFLDVEDVAFEEIRDETLKRMLVQLNTTIPKRISIRDRMRFFLKLTSSIKIDKKRLFRDIVKASLESDIVYEGTGGLRMERW
jgi:tRNA A-37 threonylcarbamoyl transferase component Bud32